MRYTPLRFDDGVGALRESDDTNFLKPNGPKPQYLWFYWTETRVA